MHHLTSTEDAVRIVEEALEAVERVLGATLPIASPLLDDFMMIIDHHDFFTEGEAWLAAGDFGDLRRRLRRQVGAIEVAKRIVALDRVSELEHYSEPLTWLRDGGCSAASPFIDYEPTTNTAIDHARKLFEFYAATGIRFNLGCQTEIAGEKDYSQLNPDILITDFEIGGIACKVVQSKNPKTMLENVEKASQQVGVSIAKGGCTCGVAALDLRHMVDEELLIPKIDDQAFRTFKHADDAVKVVRDVLANQADLILKEAPEDWWAHRCGETRRAGFLLIANAFAMIETEHGPVPTLVGQGIAVEYLNLEGTREKECELARAIGDSITPQFHSRPLC